MTPATDSMNEAELAEAEASQDVVEGEAPASAAADQAESAAEDAVQANEAEAMVPEPSDEPAEGAESAEVHADEESAPAEPVEEEPAEPEQEQAAAEEGELAGEQAAAEEAEATELPSEVEPTDGAAADVTEAEGGAEEGEEEAEPPVPEPDDGRAWYVVHCYSGDEEKVKHNLEQRTETMQMSDQIFQVVVPTEDEIEIRNGKRRTVERRVFPGYILVQMLLTDDSWYVVRNTPGVTGFVGMGNDRQADGGRGAEDKGDVQARPEGAHHRRSVQRVHRRGGRDRHGESEGAGAGVLLRARDTRRAGFPAGREDLTQQQPPGGCARHAIHPETEK
jgi:hypothetical protein